MDTSLLSSEQIHLAVNACLAPVCSLHGLAVTTVEGIGSTKTKLHPVQERIAKSHGSQCGFCTPGIVMSVYTLLRNSSKPKMKDLEVSLQGNLCRCTGYRAIIEGFGTFTEDWEQSRISNGTPNGTTCSLGSNCCKNRPAEKEEEALFTPGEFTPYDPTQEPIFPPELKISSELDKQNLSFIGKRTAWYRPTNIVDLLDLKDKYPDARIVVGNTEVGVETKFKNCVYPVLINPSMVPELSAINVTDSGVSVGASVTLNDMEIVMRKVIESEPEYKTRIFSAVVDMLHWFAGKQIRNVAAVGGNLMTGSPISDLNPIWIAARCQLQVQSKTRGVRILTMDHSFFTGYRRNVIKPDEVLVRIIVPFTAQNQYFHAYKQARRRDDDIAIVNAAFNIYLENSSPVIKDIVMAFGGMAPTTVTAQTTQQKLLGLKWNDALLEKAYGYLVNDLPLAGNAPGGMVQYRVALVLSFFFKAYLAVCQKIQTIYADYPAIPNDHESAVHGFGSVKPSSAQYFQVVPNDQKVNDPVGRPIVHKSAYKQATGEAVYCDDMPQIKGELYLALVLSSKTHARILSIDASQALALDGVQAFYSAEDLPGKRNSWGPIIHDEEVFARGVVTYQGQPVGAIVADDQRIAQQAAKLVKISYQDIEPVIVTIEDAIEKESFFPGYPKKLEKGNVDAAFAAADNILTGEARMAGQEHFYLETHCCIAVPKCEDDELHIYISSQNPTEAQKLIAEMLDIPANRVTCHVKRMGGGFGGKESRFNVVSLPVALAAHRLQRPVRCMLDRDEDMIVTGQRHPFLGRFKVSFTNTGKITGCEVYIYNNGGYSMDLSGAVLERAMFHTENSYKIDNVRVHGYVCRTNIPSNTAFRGFGGPQGMFFAETMIRDIATYLGKEPSEVAEINLYQEGNITHYNQPLLNCTLQKCWTECVARSDYSARQQEIQQYNELNKWKKRGISIVPTKFGISFTCKFLNQAGALVHVYTDGSVLLSHGGTEMGQGLHTKMIQVASRALGISESLIHISETSTDKVPNTSATAASAGSDLNGMAVLNACHTILERLQPIKKANPSGGWEDWIKAAYVERISLSATGFYRTPDIGYDWEKNEGNPFNYFTFGVACSEVEIDCLTGDHQVLRSDIVMDLGESLNPAIDIGQIEGGFIQGYGLFTLEEPIVSPNGTLLTRGPGTYKLPGFSDIPAVFNVSLLKGASNPRAVYSSKAVGEPPLFLASSIFFAIKDAISSARVQRGFSKKFKLDSPATAARIRMACEDDLTSKVPAVDPKLTPWGVTA
ncbi:hypothetical protein R5R35_008349 [Gryllus longicercus]|uniref:FAD-binding PCMH-type domain-containing protein n=1 Tax=Gryllus longicercus TaxID=2509291 RepID=A0AAN9UZE6_9ORTH